MNIKNKKGHRQGIVAKILNGGKYLKNIKDLFTDGLKMTSVDGLALAKIFNENKIDFIFIGGIVVGCHTGRPRATQDIDLIIGSKINRIIENKIGKLVNAKRLDRHPSFISYIVDSPIGDKEIIDVIISLSGSYGLALENYIELDINGLLIKIPTAEMMIVLKYTAAMSPIREKTKRLQDWVDIYSIVDANKSLKLYTIEYLADRIVPGWGEDLMNKIHDHKKN